MILIRLALLVVLLLPLDAVWAKDKPAVTVFPFSTASAENIDYIQQGVWGILITRISADNKIEVTGKDIVLAHLKKIAKKDISMAEILSLGNKLKSDFVVWGKITKNGNNIGIEGKLFEVNKENAPVDLAIQNQGFDEIIPNITDFAQRISKHVLGETPLAVTEQVAASSLGLVPEQSAQQAEREKNIIAGMKASKTGTFTSIPLSPDLLKKNPQAAPKKPK